MYLSASPKCHISSYSFHPLIVSIGKNQFIKLEIEILRQLFEFAAISKLKKEYFPRKLYEEIWYIIFHRELKCPETILSKSIPALHVKFQAQSKSVRKYLHSL